MHACVNPRLSTLYYNDFPLKRVVKVFVAGALFAAGIYRASFTDMRMSTTPEVTTPEKVARYIIGVGAVLAL